MRKALLSALPAAFVLMIVVSQPSASFAGECADPPRLFKQPLANGGMMVMHFRDDNTLCRRDIYKKGMLDCTYYGADGRVTHRQLFRVWLDKYYKHGHFGPIYEWVFDLVWVEEFHDDGKTVSRKIFFHKDGTTPRLARDYNSRGGTTSIRFYRTDGTMKSEHVYKAGRRTKVIRPDSSDETREELDDKLTARPEHTMYPPGKSSSEPADSD